MSPFLTRPPTPHDIPSTPTPTPHTIPSTPTLTPHDIPSTPTPTPHDIPSTPTVPDANWKFCTFCARNGVMSGGVARSRFQVAGEKRVTQMISIQFVAKRKKKLVSISGTKIFSSASDDWIIDRFDS
eukprot:646607_1